MTRRALLLGFLISQTHGLDVLRAQGVEGADAAGPIWRADEFLRGRRFAQAMSELRYAKESIPENDPQRLVVFERMGEIAFEERDFDAAESFYAEGIWLSRLIPGLGSVVSDLYAGMGFCLAAKGKKDFAARFFAKSLGSDPSAKTRTLVENRLKDLEPPGAAPEEAPLPPLGMPYLPRHAAQDLYPYDSEPRFAKGGRFAFTLNYPGVGLRYFLNQWFSVEARGQFQSDIQLGGLRINAHFFPSSVVRPYVGVESDYVRYKGSVTKGHGYAGEVYAGVEYFPLTRVSAQFDAGAAYLNLRDNDISLTKDGLEYVVNFGINWYFGVLELDR